MCKAVLDINLVTGNILGARNARTNEVAPMASGPASQLRLKAKKTAGQIDELFDLILFVGIAT
jgi:hypothetical protein